MSDTALTPTQRRTLHAALLSAFRSNGELRMLVRFGLGKNLAEIVKAGSGEEVTFELIEWAESQGRLRDLVMSARTANDGNPELATFAQAWLPIQGGVGVSQFDDKGPPIVPQTAVGRSAVEERGWQLLLMWLLLSAGLVVAGLHLAWDLRHPGVGSRPALHVCLLVVLTYAWWWATKEGAAQERWLGPAVAMTTVEAIGASIPGQGSLLGALLRLVVSANEVKAVGLAILVGVPVAMAVTPVFVDRPPPPLEPEPMDASVDAGARDASEEPPDASFMDVDRRGDEPTEVRVLVPARPSRPNLAVRTASAIATAPPPVVSPDAACRFSASRA